VGFFSDGENDTKKRDSVEGAHFIWLGEKMRSSSLFGLVLSGLVSIVLQSLIYIIVDKEFIVVVCDVLLISKYK